MVGIGIVAPKPESLVNLTLPEGQEDCDPHAVLILEPDRDIGGRGVIASFVGSGCLALIIVTIYYLFVFDPKVTQFPDRKRTFSKRRTTSLSRQDTIQWAAQDYVPPNPVDEYMYELQVRLYRFVGWKPRWLPGKPKIEEAFRRCILGLSDLQILTGLCVLIAGFSAIETIPAYYWQLIVYVAWFSNLTHQCGLIFLRRYLHRKPWERTWRVILISVLMILLIIAMVPSMYFNWHDNGIYDLLSTPASAAQPATPMRCFYNHETRHYMHQKTFGHPNKVPKFAATRAFQNVLISLVFLVTSYVTRVIKLFNSSSTFFRYQVRGRAGYAVRRFFAWILWKIDTVTRHKIDTEPWYLFLENPLLTFYFFFRVLLDIYASVISDVGWLYAGTLLGLWRLVAEKQAEADFVEDERAFEEEDRVMDFGQLLPLMLLASPVFATIGTFSHRSVSDATVPSERIRVVEGLDDEDRQAKAISDTTRNPDHTGNVHKLQPPLAKDKINRWNRIHFVLEDEQYWAAPWFSSALFTVSMAELSIFLVVYINLVISRGARTVFFQGLLAIGHTSGFATATPWLETFSRCMLAWQWQ
ncbi:hypothetical protein NLU13_1694 [Sarocladium strictum]|uniref:Uncharacterized protein n=1 Tax=Sarocladium strictum TaxID=5046 RepID=A0AA39GRP8_SARSR|nr:hypothetical protein NLU13_1694 [Sarocladium strictum]